jgi:hypothetical protein
MLVSSARRLAPRTGFQSRQNGLVPKDYAQQKKIVVAMRQCYWHNIAKVVRKRWVGVDKVVTDRLPAPAKGPAFRVQRDRRDLRLDACRGLALWFIFLDHIPDNPLAWLTIRNYGFSEPPRCLCSYPATPA